MNALIPMEDVNTIVPMQLAAIIVHVLIVILLMTMITVAHVRYITSYVLTTSYVLIISLLLA